MISAKQMQTLLLDVHLADGELASMPIDSARTYRDVYYDAIFNHYGIDSTVFRKSVEFYTNRPYLFNEIYSKVEKRLEALNKAEQKAVDSTYRLQRQADSIANAKRTDSLNRVMRDSLDLKRKRYLLVIDPQDSTAIGPTSVTPERLRERLLEDLGLRALTEQPNTPPRVLPLPQQEQPKTLPKPKTLPLSKPLERIR